MTYQSTPNVEKKDEDLTPKEQYEERKERRRNMRDLDTKIARREEQLDMIDTWDRIATALERLANAVERNKS